MEETGDNGKQLGENVPDVIVGSKKNRLMIIIGCEK